MCMIPPAQRFRLWPRLNPWYWRTGGRRQRSVRKALRRSPSVLMRLYGGTSRVTAEPRGLSRTEDGRDAPLEPLRPIRVPPSVAVFALAPLRRRISAPSRDARRPIAAREMGRREGEPSRPCAVGSRPRPFRPLRGLRARCAGGRAGAGGSGSGGAGRAGRRSEGYGRCGGGAWSKSSVNEEAIR